MKDPARIGGRLADSTRSPGSDATPPSGDAGGASPGPAVPDHTLVRRIGKGSYGEVWLARSALGTWRAVKIVRRSAFDDDRPFEREFAGIQRFEPVSRCHESQLNILQAGRIEDGFYYVMELADDMGHGQAIDPATYTPRNLRSELHLRGRLPAADCLRIGLALTTALEHLHKHGLVHRDVKPSNIVFVNGIPKLADIGLVARAEATLTVVGTEGFLPPEGPGTRQADLCSLGKVLYELSTGHDRHQFPELPTNLVELPDRALLGELNEVLLKACHPEPAQRYQTAAEMHADLALLESGQSVVRLRGIERRLELAQRVGLALGTVALLAGGLYFWQAHQMRVIRELAEAKTQLAREKTALAEENRRRIVRLDVANGVRLLDAGDAPGALLWFADALPRMAGDPAEAAIHRIRIRQTLNQCPRIRQVFPHAEAVVSAAFSADGRRLVTGTAEGQVRVWDVNTGEALGPPVNLEVDRLWQVRFTGDGRRVFASSLRPHGFVANYQHPTNTAVVFDVDTGRSVFAAAATNLVRADLSPDDRWLVTADADQVLRVFDARDGKPVAQLEGPTDPVVMLAMSGDGAVLASSGGGGVRLHRLPDGQPCGPVIRTGRGPVALNHDGSALAAVADDAASETNTTIQTWEVGTGDGLGPPIALPGAVRALWFLPGSDSTLFALTDRQCALFDARSHRRLHPPLSTPDGCESVTITVDGRMVAFAGADGVKGVWSLETGERRLPACLQDQPLMDLHFNPEGTQLIALDARGTATLLEARLPLEDARHRFDAPVARAGPQALLEWRRFSPDRKHFLLIPADGSVRRVDFESMTDQRRPAAPVEGVSPVQATYDASGRRGAIYYAGADRHLVVLWTEGEAVDRRFVLPHPAALSDKLLFTPDGNRLLTPCNDGRIRVWRTADGTLERSVQVPDGFVPPVLFPNGGSAFGSSGEADGFALFDFATGSVKGVPLPPFEIRAFRFNASGDRFATAASVEWSCVWDARTGQPLTPKLLHGGEVRWADWSPDDRRLLTTGLTPEVKVWDAATGEPLLPALRLGRAPLEVASWSSDGRFIVARSDENLVRVWDAATGEPVTPMLAHEGYVRLAQVVANHRLVTLTLPDLLRAWDLDPCEFDAEVLADYARLLASRSLNANGVLVGIAPGDLARLCRALRARAPGLFE